MQSLDLTVLQSLQGWLEAGHRAVLVTVARTFGASPRPPGSMVAIRDDGLLVGSVSGGCIEDDLIARRSEWVDGVPTLLRYGVTSDEARRFGLPCGGDMQLIVEAGLRAEHVQDLLARVAAGAVFFRDVDLASGAWQFRTANATDQTDINDTVFSCLHGPRWRMLIIGASEIGVYLAEIAKTLDFRVTVCDPRDGYRDAWRVSDTTLTTEMPDDAVRAMVPDDHTVVIAVSHDPKLDDMALMEALNTRAFYVGAVGSTKTSDERRQRLTGLDVSPANAARLHGPVGLAIGSRTPPEIAVAIAAELVAARNRRVLVATTAAERVA